MKCKIWPEPIGENHFEVEYFKHESIHRIVEKFANERLADMADEIPDIEIKLEIENEEFLFTLSPSVIYTAKLIKKVTANEH